MTAYKNISNIIRSLIGVDLTTGADVAIKLAHPDVSGELANLLENEYRNYVQLKNEGNDHKNCEVYALN